jgi:hypothetical protein
MFSEDALGFRLKIEFEYMATLVFVPVDPRDYLDA